MTADQTIEVAPEIPAPARGKVLTSDYLKWSCDQFLKLLESEKVKRANSRRDAHATTAFVLVPVGLCLSTRKGDETLAFETAVPSLLIALGVSVLLVLFSWTCVMKVRKIGSLDYKEFVREDVKDEQAQFEVLRDHLKACLDESEKSGACVARSRWWNMFFALAALCIVVALLALRIYNGK